MKSNNFVKSLLAFTIVFLFASIVSAVPTINSLVTVPVSITFGDAVTLNADITDSNSTITAVVFSITAPNGTVISNPASGSSGDVWSSVAFTANDLGVWDFSVTATNNNSENADLDGDFTLENTKPVITSTSSLKAYVNESYSYDINANDAEGDTLTYSAVGPAGITIDAGTGVLRWTPDTEGTFQFNVTVDDGTLSDSQLFTLTVSKRPSFAIEKLQVRVDGEKDTVKDGDKISDEAKSGSDVSFEFTIENLADSRDKQGDLMDIEIFVTIIDIDDGDDLEEESGQFDLDAGDDDKFTLDFTLPKKIQEDDYTVEIEIEGENEDGELVRIEWTLTLEVEKKSHEVILDSISLSPSEISCSRNSGIDVEVLNIGSSDEDDMALTIKNSDLGINVRETFGVDEADDEDAEWSKFITFNVPSNLPSGTYPIYVNLYYDDTKLTDSETLNLVVRDCTVDSGYNDDVNSGDDGSDSSAGGSDNEDDSGVDVIYSDETDQPYAPVTAEEVKKESQTYKLLVLISANLLVLLLILLLLAIVLKK